MSINGLVVFIVYLLLRTAIAMVGYTIHSSAFWSIVDFVFWPIALIKWLVCKEINMSVIQTTFEFIKY